MAKSKKKKPGRKKATAEERAAWRNDVYRVRLTREESLLVAAGANAAGMSISAYLRETALAAAKAK